MVLLSVAQLVFFSYAMARPHSLKVAFVSDELDDINDCSNSSAVTALSTNGSCVITKASCLFYDVLDKVHIEKVYLKSFEEAFHQLAGANVIGLIHLKANFTESVNQLLAPGKDKHLFTSKLDIEVHSDQTHLLLSMGVLETIQSSMKPFYQRLFKTCNISPAFLKSPIKFEPPIFGSFDWDYRQYIMPLLLVT